MSAQKDRLLAAAELLNMTPDDLLTALDRPIFPETLVGIARERQNRILDRPRVDPEDARTLARCFRELDIHLSAGGDLPAEWQPRPEPPSAYPPVPAVGDPDPTPTLDSDADYCAAELNDYGCTWLPGHGGPHVAGDTRQVCAVWS